MNPKKGKNGNKRSLNGIITIVIWALVLTVLFNYISSLYNNANTSEISYSKFLQMVQSDEIQSVTVGSDSITIITKKAALAPSGSQEASKKLYTGIMDDSNLISLLEKHNVEFKSEIPQTLSPVMNILLTWILPI